MRRFIDKVRLDDAARPPTEDAQSFHFVTATGQVGRLVLEPDVQGQVRDGAAGIVAYMSNHGVAHAPVPAAAARQLAELFPLWLRVLKGHEGAGQVEAAEEPAEVPDASAPTSASGAGDVPGEADGSSGDAPTASASSGEADSSSGGASEASAGVDSSSGDASEASVSAGETDHSSGEAGKA